MKVVAIQVNTGTNKTENLRKISTLITQACNEVSPDFIALPEMFTHMGGNLREKIVAAENIQSDVNNEALELLKELAKKFQVLIHAGSLCEVFENQYYNTTCIIDPEGNLLTSYRKINLFSFTASNNLQYNESTFLSPGTSVITYPYKEMIIGCTICFDLRFGALFQELIKQKVQVIIVPAAFTYETGQAHWEILCRARAIETQSYLIAPAQTGSYEENNQKKFCWGHSMIVDPWGNIMQMMDEKEGFISATLDLNYLNNIRARLPLF
jgi:predicted amidohydrolase